MTTAPSAPFLLLLALSACSPGEDAGSPREPAAPPPGTADGTGDAVTALREEIRALQARPEHDAERVRVQHLLVSFQGPPGLLQVTRSREEAERLTAELVQRIRKGEDFDKLIEQYTDDSAPGIYPMTRQSRRDMVAAFGDVGWRLEVGEVGVAGYDPKTSRFGWHIIKRLE